MRGAEVRNRSGRKNLLPIMNVDKRNNVVFGEFDENDNFEIDDCPNVKSKLTPVAMMKPSKQPRLLDPLILDKARFYNDVTQDETEAINIVRCIVFCHQAKLKYE